MRRIGRQIKKVEEGGRINRSMRRTGRQREGGGRRENKQK
jgi:hypothetical protein